MVTIFAYVPNSQRESDMSWINFSFDEEYLPGFTSAFLSLNHKTALFEATNEIKVNAQHALHNERLVSIVLRKPQKSQYAKKGSFVKEITMNRDRMIRYPLINLLV